MGTIRFAATGDSFITRTLPAGDEAAQRIATFLGDYDARFTNLEVTIHRREGFPAAQSGGTWAMAHPRVLSDLQRYGFNLIAWANNHTMDYSYGGLLATERYLDDYGFIHAGVGKNLAEAAEVKYLECKGGRVALIAATSTFHESWIAGEQRRDLSGRPGVNPLRYVTTYRVHAEQLEQLKAIADVSGVNEYHNLMVKEGFRAPAKEGTLIFGNMQFVEEELAGVTTKPHEDDMRNILQKVEEAKNQADVVLVSIHSHEMADGRKDQPAEFLTIFAKKCIDHGADAIIGHGPHVLRPIEMYNGKPIFYSLGNFIFQSETVTHLPADFYDKYGLGHGNTVSEALLKRSDGDRIGLGANPDTAVSIIATWTMTDGKLTGIELHPIEMGFGRPRYERGWPKLSDDVKTLDVLRRLSAPNGTEIDIEGAVGRIRME